MSFIFKRNERKSIFRVPTLGIDLKCSVLTWSSGAVSILKLPNHTQKWRTGC